MNYLSVAIEADNDVCIVIIKKVGVLALYQKNTYILQKYLSEVARSWFFSLKKSD